MKSIINFFKKQFLIVWLILGIGISGYYHLERNTRVYKRSYEKEVYYENLFEKGWKNKLIEYQEFNKHNKRDKSIIITIIGGLLIFGIKNNRK